jgi:hypothetical protein
MTSRGGVLGRGSRDCRACRARGPATKLGSDRDWLGHGVVATPPAPRARELYVVVRSTLPRVPQRVLRSLRESRLHVRRQGCARAWHLDCSDGLGEVRVVVRLRELLGSTLFALAVAWLPACAVETATPVIGGFATFYVDTVPPNIGLYPHVWYGDRYVYLVGDRWFAPFGQRWVMLRGEPSQLYRYRATYRPPPPAVFRPPPVVVRRQPPPPAAAFPNRQPPPPAAVRPPPPPPRRAVPPPPPPAYGYPRPAFGPRPWGTRWR